MADQDLDRSEAATPHKLKKAREQGRTARSMDLVSATVFVVAMAYCSGQGWNAVLALLRLSREAFAHASVGAEMTAWWTLIARLSVEAAAVVIPFLLALMAAAIGASVVQTGFIFSTEPLKADPGRLNPVTGFQRMFSMRTLFEGARACLKLVVLLGAAAWALASLWPQFHALPTMPPMALLRLLVEDTAALGLKLALVLAAIAFLDVLFTRREFDKQMRMSQRELKDEFKNREGDPRIRARLRELRRESLKRSLALRNTRDADVVLTNPTHYAVALRYRHGEMDSPTLVAKGAGQLAAAMREIAGRHRIVVVQSPALTRSLFRSMDIGQALPAQFHAEVARIIVWVFAMRTPARADAGSAA